MALEQPRQARQPAGGGIARDAGIHNFMTVTFALQAILQQCNPRLLGAEPIAAAQRIAYHDDGLPGAECCRYAEDCQHDDGLKALKNEHRRVPVAGDKAHEKG